MSNVQTLGILGAAPSRILINLTKRQISLDGRAPKNIDPGIHTLTFCGVTEIKIEGSGASPPLKIVHNQGGQGTGPWMKYN